MSTPQTDEELALSDPPRVAPALLLPAHLIARQALPRLLASTADWLAVRRVEGLTVYWYSFPMDWARDRVQQADPEATLKRALDLHEFLSAPVRPAQAAALGHPLDRDAVVLDGDRFVGVQAPFVAPAAPGRPAQSARPPFAQGGSGAIQSQHQNSAPPEARLPEMAGAEPQLGESEVLAIQEMLARPKKMETGSRPQTPAPEPEQVAPFTAHPRLDAPDVVQARQVFDVTVGLAEQAQAGVTCGPVVLDLPASVQTFELGVQLVVDGFEPAAGQGLQATLQVDRRRPAEATVRFQLLAPGLADDEATRLSSLRVLYLFEGQVCGMAQRRIAVVAEQPPAPDPQAPPMPAQGHGQLWAQGATQASTVRVQPAPADTPPLDLTVVIDQPDGDPSQGRFVWRFASPHTSDLPRHPVSTDLGTGGAELGGKVINEVHQATLLDMAELMVTGLGRTIRDAAPPELWQALRTVHATLQAAGERRALNVLLLTAEPHVPWELALLEDTDKLIADAPPLLGCQVNLGRWPLDHSELQPSPRIEVQHMAAVVGDYAARSGWRKLQQAMEEGAQIVQRYQAVQLAADAPQIKKLLTARLGDVDPGHGAEAVHFACHGEAMQQHALDAAVILGDGMRLSPLVFANAPLGKRSSPFLFMNACQVGKAGELLASFSGFAGEAIKGGFRGFLAPLWSVEDQLARDIALGFYEQVFGDADRAPRPVAEVLREMRARFADTEPNSLTRLAYVFYGHPGLTLRRHPAPTVANPSSSSTSPTSPTPEPQP